MAWQVLSTAARPWSEKPVMSRNAIVSRLGFLMGFLLAAANIEMIHAIDDDMMMDQQVTTVRGVHLMMARRANQEKNEDEEKHENDVPAAELELENTELLLHPACEANLANVDKKETTSGKEIPYFFNLHGSGSVGAMMQRFTRQCIGLLEASDAGKGYEGDEDLMVYDSSGNLFVNVDTSHRGGLDRAKEVRLAEQNVLQILYSPFVEGSCEMFTPEYQGRMFTMCRHPLEHEVHHYYAYYQGSATLEGLAELLQSGEMLDNPVTRQLVGKQWGALTDEDADHAMELLRRKAFVGLADKEHMKDSLVRFVKYFNWDLKSPSKWSENDGHWDTCVNRMVELDQKEIPEGLHVDEKSGLGIGIMEHHRFDALLYEFCTFLYFDEQAALVE